MSIIYALVLIFAPPALAADEDPIVRLVISPESVSVGESAELTVTVLVPTWFASPPAFPAFEVANVISRLPPDSSFAMSETIDGATWSAIERNYSITPMIGANFRIGGERMKIKYANPGAEPLESEVLLPVIELAALVPKGAEGLVPYIAGRELQLGREIEGETGSLEVGDAVVITYTAELDGLPAMFLPELSPNLKMANVSSYAASPRVEDGSVARRTEKITLVFEAGGVITIPGISLKWWNTELEQVETTSLEDLTFTVIGPAPSSQPAESGAGRDWRLVLIILSALILAGLMVSRTGPRMIRYFREAAEIRRQSESFAFNQLHRELRSRDGKAIYKAMLAWLKKLAPGMDCRRFAHQYGDRQFAEVIDQLIAAAYSDAGTAPDTKTLHHGLESARKTFLARQTDSACTAIPQLNP
jgi:hypothetical protein